MPDSIRFIGVVAVAVALSGCGGGGSSSSINLVGPWSGFYNLSTSSNFTNATMGAFSSSNDGYFADNSGNVYVLSNLSGSTPFTATLVAVAPPGQTFTNGQSAINFSVTGTYLPAGSDINMRATFVENDNLGSLSGSFNLTSGNPYHGTSTLANLEGHWAGYYVGTSGTSVTLDFSSTGNFAGNDGYGCVVNGSISQDASNTNLYDVSLQSSGQSCAGSVNGLAYESSSDVAGVFGGASGTYLYLTVFSSFSAYVMELKL